MEKKIALTLGIINVTIILGGLFVYLFLPQTFHKHIRVGHHYPIRVYYETGHGTIDYYECDSITARTSYKDGLEIELPEQKIITFN